MICEVVVWHNNTESFELVVLKNKRIKILIQALQADVKVSVVA